MIKRSIFETFVGLFMLIAIVAFAFLAFQVSGLTQYGNHGYYAILGNFDNIGDLKVRAPVTIGGVRVGEVANIALDPNTFQAKVTLNIDNKYNNIPTDSTAVILTQGLLGSNYISLTPGFDETNMRNGSQLTSTRSAIILENLIGQFLLSMDKGKDKGDSQTNAAPAAQPATATTPQPNTAPQQNNTTAPSQTAPVTPGNTTPAPAQQPAPATVQPAQPS